MMKYNKLPVRVEMVAGNLNCGGSNTRPIPDAAYVQALPRYILRHPPHEIIAYLCHCAGMGSARSIGSN
jgi:hypothetical protein